MSSDYEINDLNSKPTCRGCLTVGDDVFLMTNQEIYAYRNLINKMPFNNESMYVCIYCGYLLKKITKFMEQCHKAEQILSNSCSKESKFVKLQNFTKQTLTLVMIDDDDDFFDDRDDVPLVMLRSDEDNVKKRKKKKIKNEVIEENDINIKTEPLNEDNGEFDDNFTTAKTEKKNKRQKTIREGFSSRMVQETDEYVVIKLTKEQVLEEMRSREASEEYQRALYKCEKCVKGFNFEDVLRTHMEKHTMENGALLCDICTQYCPTTISLRGHIKSHTTRYACKVCGIQRGSRQHLLEHHAISHTEAAACYSCQRCQFATNKRTVMQRHARSHSPRERFPCHRCGETLKSLDTLRVHTARHDKKRIQCSRCSRSFVSPAMLARHARAAHSGSDYYCVECDIRFKSQDNLRLHFKKAKRHRDASSYRYQCQHCPQRFVTQSSLSGHLSSAHGAPKQHGCATCRREYSSREALRAHVRAAHAHAGAGQTCRVCKRSFTRKSVLSAHERTHTGERPFSCACGAAFAQRATLRAHAHAKHHKPTDTSFVNEEVPLNISELKPENTSMTNEIGQEIPNEA